MRLVRIHVGVHLVTALVLALIVSTRCGEGGEPPLDSDAGEVDGVIGSDGSMDDGGDWLTETGDATSTGDDAADGDTEPLVVGGWQRLPLPYVGWEASLGPITLDDDGRTPPVELVLPEGTGSFLVTMTGAVGSYLVPALVVGASGAELVPKAWDPLVVPPYRCMECPNPVLAGDGASTLMVPVTPTVAIEESYTVVWRGFEVDGAAGGYGTVVPAAGTLSLHVVTKDAGVEGPWAVDLAIHATGAGGLTGATALEDPRVVAMLEEVDAIWAQAELSLGTITSLDTSGPAYVTSVAGPDNDLAALFEAAISDEPGIAVFLVGAIDSSGSVPGSILGITPGLPGPAFEAGGPRSGMALVLPEDPWDATLGLTAAHELGHYLGLFHTTEVAPHTIYYDPLDDTAEDVDGNLMYQTAVVGGTALTEDQAWVVARHPLVYPLDKGSTAR